MIVLGKQMPEDIEIVYNKIKKDIGSMTITTGRTNGTSKSLNSFSKYEILIQNNIDDIQFWDLYLHELTHITQFKDGYESIKITNRISQTLDNILMDIDVFLKLKNKYGYTYKSKVRDDMVKESVTHAVDVCKTVEDAMISVILCCFLSVIYDEDFANTLILFLNVKFNWTLDKYVKFITLINTHKFYNNESFSVLQKESCKLFDV